jgi:hypothetical protein
MMVLDTMPHILPRVQRNNKRRHGEKSANVQSQSSRTRDRTWHCLRRLVRRLRSSIVLRGRWARLLVAGWSHRRWHLRRRTAPLGTGCLREGRHLQMGARRPRLVLLHHRLVAGRWAVEDVRVHQLNPSRLWHQQWVSTRRRIRWRTVQVVNSTTGICNEEDRNNFRLIKIYALCAYFYLQNIKYRFLRV